MPKRKHQKIKKKKRKSKQHKSNKSRCNIAVRLCIPSDCKDVVIIQATSKEHVVFTLKSKKAVLFNTPQASKMLACLAYSRNRWDIIATIASWCNSFSKENIDSNDFWTQYIQKLNAKNEPIRNDIILIIIERIKDMLNECIGSKCYYSRQDWTERMRVVVLADFELELLSVGFLRHHIKNINHNRIPMDIISVFGAFFGYLSEYMFDAKNNVLFTSRKKYGKSLFVGNGQYAIYKKGFEMNGVDTLKFKFSVKVLDTTQYFGIGIGIYNERMSENLSNGKWVLNKDEYLKNYSKCRYKKKQSEGIKVFGSANKQWNVNDICTVVVIFGQDSSTEYTSKWLLSVMLYRNGEMLQKQMLITDDMYNKNNEYKDSKRYCHVIFDNKPISKADSSSFKLQLLESINSSIIDKIEWWRRIIVDAMIYFLEESRYNERKRYGKVKNIQSVDEKVENDILTLEFRYYDKYSIQVRRDDARILMEYTYHYGTQYKTVIDNMKPIKIEGLWENSFQFVAML